MISIGKRHFLPVTLLKSLEIKILRDQKILPDFNPQG